MDYCSGSVHKPVKSVTVFKITAYEFIFTLQVV